MNGLPCYQIHRWDFGTPVEETLLALHDLVQMGKIHHVGACNLTGWQLQTIVDICKHRRLEHCITLQV